MSKVVGVDLGTTNSLVAYVKDGVPQIIRDGQGDGLVPSVVSFSPEGTTYVGREAQRRLLPDPRRAGAAPHRRPAHGLFRQAVKGQGARRRGGGGEPLSVPRRRRGRRP